VGATALAARPGGTAKARATVAGGKLPDGNTAFLPIENGIKSKSNLLNTREQVNE
jgi:hypothetical protein